MAERAIELDQKACGGGRNEWGCERVRQRLGQRERAGIVAFMRVEEVLDAFEQIAIPRRYVVAAVLAGDEIAIRVHKYALRVVGREEAARLQAIAQLPIDFAQSI